MKKPVSALCLLAGVAALTLLGGCIIVDADEHVRADWNDGRNAGALKGAEIAGDVITARVTSNGCTTKDFIKADVDKTGDNRFSVAFYRDREDFCEAYMPEGVALDWSFTELGIPAGAEVRIRNEIAG